MISLRGILVLAAATVAVCLAACGTDAPVVDRPNILFAISDDQSFPHASAYGSTVVSTPAFDRVAREGVLFTNYIAPSPGCSPSRAAVLTGRHTWQIEHAGTHASSFPAKYVAFPDLLEQAGYWVGYTGKGWGPGRWQNERPRNPAGPEWSELETEPRLEGISTTDYAGNFQRFLEQRPEGRPFYFWYGAREPHRVYDKGSGLRAGKTPADVEVPSFLPETDAIRSDILDYAVEIEWFDRHLARMLDLLEEAGELDNTLVIVTSDNGMPFPRAKANVYEYGIHLPLAIRWASRVEAGRVSDELVGGVDLTATILDAAGVEPPRKYPMSGRSLMSILGSGQQNEADPPREHVFSARERHSSSRYSNLGYPQRAIRTRQYLYIRNFAPDRWPAGAPQKYDDQGTLGPMHGGYHDIDPSPSLDVLVENRAHPDNGRYLHLSVDKRPAEELFDIQKDPGCLENLADDPELAQVRAELWRTLERYLQQTGDPRVSDNGDIWESYPRYVGVMRSFPEN